MSYLNIYYCLIVTEIDLTSSDFLINSTAQSLLCLILEDLLFFSYAFELPYHMSENEQLPKLCREIDYFEPFFIS